ncbi:MAG TPA: hypothetical protein VGR24_00475 [bacterium]|jgi:hypothetical protein|nr:hypothetical protein [bacterium]
MLAAIGALILAAIALAVLVSHHIAYFRRARIPSFGAFLETAGWMILLLVALAALGGGLRDPGTARVEAATATVGVICAVVGWRLRSRMVSDGRG